MKDFAPHAVLVPDRLMTINESHTIRAAAGPLVPVIAYDSRTPATPVIQDNGDQTASIYAGHPFEQIDAHARAAISRHKLVEALPPYEKEGLRR